MVDSRATARQIAEDLLEIEAVTLAPDDPFTWSSGLRSPIYCDNRVTLSFPAVRGRILEAVQQLVQQHELHPEVVAGTATAGIPQAALLADRMELPLVYVRSAAKQHGRGRRIEGRITPGQRVVVVEDLISTGGSALDAVRALEEAGAEVAAVLAVFTYGLPQADRAFERAGVPLYTACTFGDLLEVARREYLEDHQVAALESWQQDPQSWSDERQPADA